MEKQDDGQKRNSGQPSYRVLKLMKLMGWLSNVLSKERMLFFFILIFYYNFFLYIWPIPLVD